MEKFRRLTGNGWWELINALRFFIITFMPGGSRV